MKKLLSVVLALVLVLSLATVAFAANPAVQDQSNSFTKKYTVTNGTAPAETFGFTATFQSYKNNEGEAADMSADNAPAVTVGTAAFATALTADGSANVSVSVGSVQNAALGVYTYQITENVPTTKTAGVTYNADPVYLVLTVLRDDNSGKHYVAAIHYETAGGDKTGEIVNSYNAGNLTVTKQIEGNMADMEKEFTFTITLTAPTGTAFDSTVQNAIAESGVQPESVEYNAAKSSVEITVDLGDGDSINITNIPVGTTYTVSEDADGYESDHEEATEGSIAGGDNDQDTWTNTKTSEVDTGITLDSMPFVIILAICAVAAVLFVTKRRRVEE